MWVRGLKHFAINCNRVCIWSHPMWVRGLKPLCCRLQSSSILSHPMWVRGLKLPFHHRNDREQAVAPYVGAWIETCQYP